MHHYHEGQSVKGHQYKESDGVIHNELNNDP